MVSLRAPRRDEHASLPAAGRWSLRGGSPRAACDEKNDAAARADKSSIEAMAFKIFLKARV